MQKITLDLWVGISYLNKNDVKMSFRVFDDFRRLYHLCIPHISVLTLQILKGNLSINFNICWGFFGGEGREGSVCLCYFFHINSQQGQLLWWCIVHAFQTVLVERKDTCIRIHHVHEAVIQWSNILRVKERYL